MSGFSGMRVARREPWQQAAKLLQNFPGLVKKHAAAVMERESAALYQAVKSAAGASSPNSPVTLILKRASRPLMHTGASLVPANFKLHKRGRTNKLEFEWGIPKGRPVPTSGSKQSRFKDLAALLIHLHGGPNLERPRPYMTQKLSQKAQRLFALVHRASMQPRGGRGTRTRGKASPTLTGRAAEVLKAAKGSVVPALRRPLRTKSRPFFRDAWRKRQGALQVAMQEIFARAFKESLGG